jgi:hypothetical protein
MYRYHFALLSPEALIYRRYRGSVPCSYQGLVLSAMVEKRLDFNQLVAVVNNNLIAYDQARDLASVIDSAIRANNDRGADDGDDSMLEGAAETSRRGSRERGGRRSTDSDGAMMMDTEIHSQMEDANRYVPILPTRPNMAVQHGEGSHNSNGLGLAVAFPDSVLWQKLSEAKVETMLQNPVLVCAMVHLS